MDCLVDICNNHNGKELPETLPPEEEEGNVEYKLKLVNPSPHRIEHLVTQMKWRLEEGSGEAIYEIGVEDSGMLTGLNDADLKASLTTLDTMAQRLGASLTVLREKTVGGEDHSGAEVCKAMEILVRKVPDHQELVEVRVAVVGNVEGGKSTLLGVLTHGERDNGRGSARLNLFRHLHEIQSGRTSSISYDVLGFDSKGQVVNYAECRSMEEICEQSSKMVTLVDLAGHPKYLRTTVFGLTGTCPDFAMLVVSATTGIVVGTITGIAGTTKEHLGYALVLGVPVIVVVNKVDLCRPGGRLRLLSQLDSILKSPGCNKIPVHINSEEDAVTVANSLDTNKIVPIFTVSCVTGQHLDLIIKFLQVLPPRRSHTEREHLAQDLTEFQIDELFSVPHVGTVVGGVIKRGSIREGEKLLVGPSDEGTFEEVKVRTVHRNRLPCRLIQAGQAASVALIDVERERLRKGMVLLSPSADVACCRKFEADVYVLFHSNKISRNFQTTVHIGTVCQTAVITSINKSYIKTNEKARVVFAFKFKPEYLRVGARLLFRDGKSKGVGEVSHVFPFDAHIP
ncbi:hypothetical protein ACOMHN_038088 [Nucella lapillus]